MATQLHQINRSLGDMIEVMSGKTASQIETEYSYPAGDGAKIRDYFDSMANLLDNASGAGVIADGTNAPIALTENAKYRQFGA